MKGCFLCSPDADLVYWSDRTSLALCGLGPVVKGHSVVATKKHIRSAADAAAGEALGFLPFALDVRDRLARLYGQCLLTEHGRLPVCIDVSGTTDPHCYHAHFLMFPGALTVEAEARLYFARNEYASSLEEALEMARAHNEYFLLSPDPLWGDYWISDSLHDSTPRLFPSAIALLSFTLLRDKPSPVDEALVRVADKIEERLIGSKRLPMLHVAAASAAILATKDESIGSKTRSRIADIAYSSHPKPNLADLSVYFYEYQNPDMKGQIRFGRDYFIVPTEMLVAISGFQSGAPDGLRQRAEAILNSLTKNLQENDGAYRPDAEQRISSKNQAWAALLLKVSSSEHKPIGLIARAWYCLGRPRTENWLTNKLLPAVSMITVTLGNVFLNDAGPLVRAIAAVSVLTIGGLYGPTIFRRFFPGRE